MPEVFLDDARLDFEDSGKDSTVGDLVDAIEREIRPLKRFIAEIQADGQVVADWKGAGLLTRPISSYGILKLNTASVESVANEGLRTVEAYLAEISAALDGVSARLRSDGSMTGLSGIFEGIIEVVKTLKALSSGLGQDHGGLLLQEQEVFCHEALARLESINEARENYDTIRIADILEYEIAPLLAGFKDRAFSRH